MWLELHIVVSWSVCCWKPTDNLCGLGRTLFDLKVYKHAAMNEHFKELNAAHYCAVARQTSFTPVYLCIQNKFLLFCFWMVLWLILGLNIYQVFVLSLKLNFLVWTLSDIMKNKGKTKKPECGSFQLLIRSLPYMGKML